MMKVSDVAGPLSPDRWTILPVTRWESVQFSPAVSRKRVETTSVPLPFFWTISEAHGSEREVAFGRRISSFNRIGRSRAGARFRTTMRSPAYTW
jgi:hypothetical protein